MSIARFRLKSKGYVAPPTPTPTPTPAAPFTYGRVAGYDAGTTGDWFVATTGNDTTGNGSVGNPYRTWQKAHDVASPGQTIKVRGGTYYERLTQTKALTITGYGTEVAVLSGGLKLTSWTQCTSGDQAVVGSNYASIYKATINKSQLDTTKFDYYHMMLPVEEDSDTILHLCQRRADASDLFEQTNDATCYSSTRGDAVSMTVDGNNYIQTITHAAVLGTYTDAQLARTYAMVHADPNVPAVIKVASASGGVLTLAANTSRPQKYASTPQYTYALLNILPAIAQGQYGFVDNGSTLDLYVWPTNAGALATSGITFISKSHILDLSSAAAGSTYRNIRFEMAADSSTSGYGMIKTPLAGVSNLDFRQCIMRRFSHWYRGSAGLHIYNCDNFVLRNCTIYDAQNQFGVYLRGSSGGGWGNGARVEYNHIYHISQTGVRAFGQLSVAVRFNLFENTGKGAHSNKLNFYQGSDIILAQGNKFVDCDGYMTIQQSSRFLALMNQCPSNFTDTRAFDDQTGSSLPPTDPSNNYLINNHFPLTASGVDTSATAISATKDGGSADPNWGVYNNVSHGITIGATQLIGREYNLLTKGSVVGTGEATAVASAIYTNPATDDWRTTAGTVLITMSGKDVTSIIAEWEGYFPDLDLRLDMLGSTWNPASPGVGPYVKGDWPVAA